MLDFLKRRFQYQIRVVEREPFKLTVDEWRSDRGLCAQAEAALKSPIIRMMLQTLSNSHPAFQVLTDCQLSDRAVQQARSEGYTMLLSDFESLAKFKEPVKEITAEFGEEELPEDEIKKYRLAKK